jgi:DNA-binding GntR family transcriptional regulator
MLSGVPTAKPLRDEIADALRADIIAGRLEPGSRLREEHIAGAQGVSRVPVREALQRLEREGYLVLTPRRGATVARPSPERALQVMEVRRALEVLAVRKAARARGGAVAGELERIVDRGFAAIERRRLASIPPLIDRFHELVAVASGNGELVVQLDELRRRVRWLFEVDVEHRSPGSWADHRAILDAIVAGDARTAARLMDRHVEKDEEVYRRLVDGAGA